MTKIGGTAARRSAFKKSDAKNKSYAKIIL